MSKKRFLCILAVAILETSNVTLTQAWEFSMSGSLMWTYEMYSQQGRAGFFGPYDVDASAAYDPHGWGNTQTAANLNLWNGINRAFNVQMASGSDVAISYLQADLWPTIRINQAIDVRGRFRIGRYGSNSNVDDYTNSDRNSDAYQYRTWSNPGTLNNMGAYWPLLWGTVRTPWGTISYGKRPMPFGTGLQYDGDSNITTESISLTTYFGPLTISFGFYPYRQAPNYGSDHIHYIERNAPAYGLYYYNVGDKSGIRKKDVYGALVYSNGNIEMGLYEAYFSYHVGPESVLNNVNRNRGTRRISYFPDETYVTHGAIYAKYSNGRIFVNTEFAWWFDKTLDTTKVEQLRCMTEFGVVSGPARLSFVFGYTPGLDRRHGEYIDKQPAGFLRQPELTRELAGITLWRQYGYLMSYVYGSGLAGVLKTVGFSDQLYSGYDMKRDSKANQGLNQEGTILDAVVFATRLDYAVASNLNIYGSFFWAERTSKSYPWGFISPDYSSFDVEQNYPFYTGNVSIDFDKDRNTPSIPDTSLGYEIDLGISWKLLENWTVDLIASRWQPGYWFKYACIDKSVAAWRSPTTSNNFGTNPSRSIDPIWGLRVDLTSSF